MVRLESERLSYEKFTQEHFADYFRLVSEQDVMQYITGAALNEEQAKARFQVALNADRGLHHFGFLAVFEKETGTFTGLAKIVPFETNLCEIGYALFPAFWGKGYATEITRTMVSYAKQLGNVPELIALVSPENHSSVKVLTKQGFVFFREIVDAGGTRHDYILRI
ncbi:GNAT family N-acetyltransferase [Dyadobacter sp. Leaf189]|uniref:GNAT family N-acetyltransferase n=1 Tax=Dyadobacter sp. Leaf189 TaxID=1736295 RepID=UPI00070216B7|nr:GNAT family N-acetyltransferase [Dyadobacter sp. Leaf189]KQS34052.1 N-acetyltransferase GCN5 [Dyadobacter sp. Leaf189]